MKTSLASGLVALGLILGLSGCPTSGVAVPPGSDADVDADPSSPDRPASPDTGVVVDTGPPPDVGLPAPGTGVPHIDATLKAALRTVFLRGQSLGNRPNVFAKIGDSITESGSFLMDFGPSDVGPDFNLGGYPELIGTVNYFNQIPLDGIRSSFSHASAAAVGGWSSGRALEGSPTPVQVEIAALRPAIAVVMFGTNDIDQSDVTTFRSNMDQLVTMLLANGVIPVLSTIPDRQDTAAAGALVPSFNAAIRSLAAARTVPVEDFWQTLQPLPNHGLNTDGIHPNAYSDPADGSSNSAYLTADGLRFGYNMRNLLTLQTLARIVAVVIADGPPDA